MGSKWLLCLLWPQALLSAILIVYLFVETKKALQTVQHMTFYPYTANGHHEKLLDGIWKHAGTLTV